MTTGKENQVTKQCGEYLVAAELLRRGYINTTFTGNMPNFDIVAINKQGKLKRIQVKTTTRYTFRLNLQKYANVVFKGKKQKLVSRTKLNDPKIINIFVKLGDQNPKSKWRKDEFYLLTDLKTRNLNYNRYNSFLRRHKGIRPRNPKSIYNTLSTDDLAPYQDNWTILEN